MKRPSQICTRCIMDTTDNEIEFDEKGVCNHCRQYDRLAKQYLFTGNDGEKELQKIFAKIKEKGKGKEYDCIIGLSGGVDSTYTAYIAKKYGLRLLAVHFDNGWNSELSVKNIENIVKKLGLDLQTYVIDWEEFKDLQLSFFKAGVLDIELLTDHAIIAAMYRLTDEMGIKYILSGHNIATEAILPRSWAHLKTDLINIKSIQKRYGKTKIRNFPTADTFKLNLWYKYVKGIKLIMVLNYINYIKKDAMSIIENELEWKYYGGKHHESIFTRFYQAYILPNKFGIDKRKAHLSSLICSGQITREEALEEMKKELYNPELLASDKEFVLKKLGFSEDEFERYMKEAPKSHLDYPSEESLFNILRSVKRIINKAIG